MTDDERTARLCAFVASLPEPKRPPLVVPDEGFLKPEQIFHHVDPRLVPEIADVLEHLMEHHPNTLAAVGDVDRTLIWCSMERTPLENLAYAQRMSAFNEDSLREGLRDLAANKAA